MIDFVVENNILKGTVEPVDVDQKFGRLIYDALNESPDHVAQIDVDTDEKTTCREMKERGVRCAVWMKKWGTGPYDIVAVVTHNHLDSCVPFFTTFFVDAVFSAWHHGLTLYSARRFMTKFAPKLIFSCEKAVDVLAEAAKLENFEVKLVEFGKHSKAQLLDEILKSRMREEVEKFVVVNENIPQDVAAVMLSSGSSGFPKRVMLSNTCLLTTTKEQEFFSPTPKCLWYSTPEWLTCTIFIVNFAFVSPILVNYVAKSNLARNYDLQSLNSIFIGGCKHSKKILEGIRQNIPIAFIYHTYGSTELAISSTTSETKCIESAGFVAANCQIKCFDSTSSEVLGPHQKGEICVKKPTPMIGYYKDPASTRQASDEEGWYRTGDVGYYDETGAVFIVDRIKEIMKCKYYHVSPVEIEELLLSLPEVQEAAMVAIPHELDGDWPTAFVKKTPGGQVTNDDIVELTSVLEDYKKLRGGNYFIDNLPQTGSGNVAKNELRQLAINLKNSN